MSEPDRLVSTDTEVLKAYRSLLGRNPTRYLRMRRTDYPIYVWHRGWSYRIDAPRCTSASVNKRNRHAKRPSGRR